MNWLIQICQGLDYLHSHKIIHRDLKAENIFLTENDGAKIGDFGVSKLQEATMAGGATQTGTYTHMAPEVLNKDWNEKYSDKADMWSLGVLLYDLCTGETPFKLKGQNILAYAVSLNQDPVPPIPNHLPYSKDLRQLIYSLLEKQPEKRLSAAQVLDSDFVKDQMSFKIADDVNLDAF